MSDHLAENYKNFISEQLLLQISDALIILQLQEGQSGGTEMLYLMKVNQLEELYISVKNLERMTFISWRIIIWENKIGIMDIC